MIRGDPYVEVRPGGFRRDRGWGIDAAFGVDPSGRVDTLRTSSRTYRRVHGPLSIRHQRFMFLGSLAILGISLLIWAVRGLLIRLRRRPREKHWPWVALAATVALAYVTFMVRCGGDSKRRLARLGCPSAAHRVALAGNAGGRRDAPCSPRSV